MQLLNNAIKDNCCNDCVIQIPFVWSGDTVLTKSLTTYLEAGAMCTVAGKTLCLKFLL